MLLPIAEPSQVGHARRIASERAAAAGLDEERAGRVALVVTELATNLLKHANGGELFCAPFCDGEGDGYEVLSLDKGPGITDMRRAMSDGYSTAGTLGGGLGAVERKADRFALFTRPQLGTVIMARFIAQPPAGDRAKTVLGALVHSYPGERVSGDAWSFAQDSAQRRTLLMVDGSGHGDHAARAADVATQAFLANSGFDCVRLVETLHRALAPTRGAALAVARLDPAEKLIRFVGVGNIVAALAGEGKLRHMVSNSGTAGHVAPRIREFTYPYVQPPLVILHSDGLSARWDLDAYPGLAAAHPSIAAAVLFRDFRRGRDDASIVAMRPLQ